MLRTYRYGLLPPTEGATLVHDQITLAHRYYNDLITIEQGRRMDVDTILDDNGLAVPRQQVVALELLRKEQYSIAAKERSEARSKSIDPTAAAAIKLTTRELKNARSVFGSERRRIREIPSVVGAVDLIRQSTRIAAKAARKDCSVYWGTYLQIEQAVDAAKSSIELPRFHRWTGEGSVAVQIQNGLSVLAATACEDTRLRIDLRLRNVPGRSGKAIPRVSIRVGSIGRNPIWAEWPMIYHRPLPPGSIKWAVIKRRRVASHYKWSVHFSLDMGALPIDSASNVRASTTAFVNLSWAQVSSGSSALCVAQIQSNNISNSVVMDPAIRSALLKVESLRSIRDKRANEMKDRVLPMIRALELPVNHADRITHIAHWRSLGRWAGLALWWAKNRTEGDAKILQNLERWRARDKHLWEWEANARRKAIARRRNDYRVVAAKLARENKTLVLETLNLAAIARKRAPEDSDNDNKQARKQRVDVAPSEFRIALIQAFDARDRTVVYVPASPDVDGMVAAFREGLGREKKAAPARSSRFNRLRGIVESCTPETGSGKTALAK